MTGFCCVCRKKGSGFILCDEFICFSCHYEVTGEGKKTKRRESIRQINAPANRRQIRDNLIFNHLVNKITEGGQ